MDILLNAFEPALYAKYAKFATKAWGKNTYQASLNYIQWLYSENPLPNKRLEDFLIIKNNLGEIVGCTHKLRQPWSVYGEILNVPALHNLFVNEENRKGIGVLLMLTALTGEVGIIAAGCGKEISKIYRKLKRYHEVEACWYRQILRPIPTILKYFKAKLVDSNPQNETPRLPSDNEARYSTDPDHGLITQLLSSYHTHTQHFDIKQHYDEAFFKWRFFSPTGPQHVLIYCKNEQGSIDFIIDSIGQHRALRVARIIEAAFLPQSFHLLHAAMLKLFRLNHVDAFAVFSTDPALNTALQQKGYNLIKKSPLTFIYYANKQYASGSFRMNGAGGDFGFESIPRST